MSDVLAHIARYKRDEVTGRKAAASQNEIEVRAALASPARGFADVLDKAKTPGRLALIGEIKKASPSKGLIRSDFDPARLAGAYSRGGATCLSVLTDGPSFQGADADLATARDACALPCLRKEFIIDPWQVAESRALGADAILLILALADDSLAREIISEAGRFGMDVLVETHDAAELHRAAALDAKLIGINNRDLRTFVTDLAVTERLAQEAPVNAIIISESGISAASDVTRLANAGAAAMLVGESLMRHADVEAATRLLLAP